MRVCHVRAECQIFRLSMMQALGSWCSNCFNLTQLETLRLMVSTMGICSSLAGASVIKQFQLQNSVGISSCGLLINSLEGAPCQSAWCFLKKRTLIIAIRSIHMQSFRLQVQAPQALPFMRGWSHTKKGTQIFPNIALKRPVSPKRLLERIPPNSAVQPHGCNPEPLKPILRALHRGDVVEQGFGVDPGKGEQTGRRAPAADQGGLHAF